jgi:AcrR family transcriptional regulator
MGAAIWGRSGNRRNRPNLYADEVLLDAAAAVFERRGYHEASMVEIADEAGASKPTLYARFGNKEALYDRVLERAADSLVRHMLAAFDGVGADSAIEASRRPAVAFFAWVRSHPTGFHLLFTPDQGLPTQTNRGAAALAVVTEQVASASEEFLESRGLRPGRLTGLIAAYVVGVLEHGARWAAYHDELTDEIAEFSAAFIYGGLEGVSPDAISAATRRRRST